MLLGADRPPVALPIPNTQAPQVNNWPLSMSVKSDPDWGPLWEPVNTWGSKGCSCLLFFVEVEGRFPGCVRAFTRTFIITPATSSRWELCCGRDGPTSLVSGPWACGSADLRLTQYCGKPAGHSKEQSNLVVRKSMGFLTGTWAFSLSTWVFSLTQHSFSVWPWLSHRASLWLGIFFWKWGSECALLYCSVLGCCSG